MVRAGKNLLRRTRLVKGPLKHAPGSAPGTLSRNPLSYPTQILVICYGPEGYTEQACDTVEAIEQVAANWPVVWINVTGLADIDIIERLGMMFGLDKLSLEDALDINHRPKVEYYENYVFTVMKGGSLGDQFENEHVCLFLKKNVVIVFQEKPSHAFEQVRERIRRGTGKIRHAGTDYLYYALLDEVIDRYFPILDKLNYQLSVIEEQIFTGGQRGDIYTDSDTIQQIHHTKGDLLLLHRTIYPISDIIGMLMREDSPLITKITKNFLRDCFDHSIQANELAQFYRDTAGGLLNTYLAYEGHKTNEIVKVLTMVSAVFIPLNLVASIYGMNFDNMIPHYDWHYGFLYVVLIMMAMAFVMLMFFYRKGWIASGLKRDEVKKAPSLF